jgi:hypothetical protein
MLYGFARTCFGMDVLEDFHEKNLKCVAIEVGESRGRYFAVKYSGRSSKKEPSYYFPLRIGESNRLIDFRFW